MPQSPPRLRLGSLIAFLLLLVTGAAAAQVRAIPTDAKRGEIRHIQGMRVDIAGQHLMLAPGAQIRDTSNRLILPIALPAGATIKYVLDLAGQPRRIWILTPEEIAARDAPPEAGR